MNIQQFTKYKDYVTTEIMAGHNIYLDKEYKYNDVVDFDRLTDGAIKDSNSLLVRALGIDGAIGMISMLYSREHIQEIEDIGSTPATLIKTKAVKSILLPIISYLDNRKAMIDMGNKIAHGGKLKRETIQSITDKLKTAIKAISDSQEFRAEKLAILNNISNHGGINIWRDQHTAENYSRLRTRKEPKKRNRSRVVEW